MSTIRVQPHGQPWPAPVTVPYTSSETHAQSRPHSLTALWAPGPVHTGREPLTVIGSGCAPGLPAANSDTSAIAKPPASSAKYARLPSLLMVSEWRPPAGLSPSC